MSIKILNNQDGFALITSMIFLVVLTIIGIAATNTTTIEVGIAGNERIYKQNFYLAEGAAKEATKEDLESGWVVEVNKPPFPVVDIKTVCTEPSGLGPNINFGVVDNDIPQGVIGTGHSLKTEGTGAGGRMNFFDIYGQSTQNNGSVRIVVGYTRRL